PLGVALDAAVYYLQWSSSDLIETAAALIALTVLFSVLLFAIWPKQGRGATLALMLVALLPLASFAAGAVRQLPFDDAARAAWDNRALRWGAPAVVMIAIGFGWLFRPDVLNR